MYLDELAEIAKFNLGLTTKELASIFGVKKKVFRRWRDGVELMPPPVFFSLLDLADVSQADIEAASLVGSFEDAFRWGSLFYHLACEVIRESGEEHAIDAFEQELGDLTLRTLKLLHGLGVPLEFPETIDFDYEGGLHEDQETLLGEYQIVRLIREVYRSRIDILNFVDTFLPEFAFSEDFPLWDETGIDLEDLLMSLASTKISFEPSLASNWEIFSVNTVAAAMSVLSEIKRVAIVSGVPLEAELMDLVGKTHPELAEIADLHVAGENMNRVHPDIYTNEMLTGMRRFNKVLPEILKKLGIDEAALEG